MRGRRSTRRARSSRRTCGTCGSTGALREPIGRGVNYLYGREPGFEEKAREAAKKLGGKRAKLYHELRNAYQQEGDDEALEQARAMLQESQSLSMSDRERLFGYLEGARKIIL